MSEHTNPDRPTSTGKLWAIGTLGGLLLAVGLFLTSGDNAQDTRSTATSIGAWAMRALLVAVIVAGGWKTIRRSKASR